MSLQYLLWGLGTIHKRVVQEMAGDWYFIAEQPAPAPHLAQPEECAALRIVLVTVPRVSRSCEHFPDGFDLHLLRAAGTPVQRQEHGPAPEAQPLPSEEETT